MESFVTNKFVWQIYPVKFINHQFSYFPKTVHKLCFFHLKCQWIESNEISFLSHEKYRWCRLSNQVMWPTLDSLVWLNWKRKEPKLKNSRKRSRLIVRAADCKLFNVSNQKKKKKKTLLTYCITNNQITYTHYKNNNNTQNKTKIESTSFI